MDKELYQKIENYMLSCMSDSVHDCQHIYRVLYMALDIGKKLNIDRSVLIAASLLHDIGRDAEYNDSSLDHAVVGANMAYEFMIELGWEETRANHVKECIITHRYRTDLPPESIEAKILFDADKLDISGAVGIARTLQFGGIISEPLYSVDSDGRVLDGSEKDENSFFNIVNNKLLKLENKLYTDRAKEICRERKSMCINFYEGMFKEVSNIHNDGIKLLQSFIDTEDKS
ncbi:HD domain-containing protein [Wukongibacter baidiensis]|uniref:HD domain-containing protein n=1 Tax=Wukongibacter baidiensis TaxID=1723361 RepID=UPI003D7FEAA5